VRSRIDSAAIRNTSIAGSSHHILVLEGILFPGSSKESVVPGEELSLVYGEIGKGSSVRGVAFFV